MEPNTTITNTSISLEHLKVSLCKQFSPSVLSNIAVEDFLNKATGDMIREIDVFERLMINYNIENINGIPSRMEKAKTIQKFNKKIPHFIEEIKKKEKDLTKHLSKVDDECYLEYLEEKNKDLKKELFPKINLKKLHVARKKIKELVYLNDIGNKNKLNSLRDLENAIGSWHDKQMVLQLLKNDTDKSHQILIKKIKTEASNEIKLIKKMKASIEV